MKITDFCEGYFDGFQNVSNYKKNNIKSNVFAVLKILSYFTVVIPLSFAIIYGSASLYSRISKKENLSSSDESMNQIRLKLFSPVADRGSVDEKPSGEVRYQVIQIDESRVVRPYTADLTEAQKANLESTFTDDDNRFSISFKKNLDFNVSIRAQDLFASGAQVIVNAANRCLGGGGGIDGAINRKGGEDYQKAHKDLQTHYESKYVCGHAAMIESGSLSRNHWIDNVIVVAGPQGPSSDSEKENELYSCYYNSLLLAHSQGKASIAFPSISTGIFAFPKDRAASISLKAVYDFICKYPDTTLKTISIHFLAKEKKLLKDYENTLASH